MSKISEQMSAMTRSGTLAPPSTATNGSNITRADFQRWAHEDRNHAQANDTRRERDERRRFKAEQKESLRMRGQQLKEMQKEQMSTTAERVATHKQGNSALGSTLREDEDRMRKRRAEQQKKWADHGYELTQQYTIKAAQNNIRSLKAQNAGIVNGMHAQAKDNASVHCPHCQPPRADSAR